MPERRSRRELADLATRIARSAGQDLGPILVGEHICEVTRYPTTFAGRRFRFPRLVIDGEIAEAGSPALDVLASDAVPLLHGLISETLLRSAPELAASARRAAAALRIEVEPDPGVELHDPETAGVPELLDDLARVTAERGRNLALIDRAQRGVVARLIAWGPPPGTRITVEHELDGAGGWKITQDRAVFCGEVNDPSWKKKGEFRASPEDWVRLFETLSGLQDRSAPSL
jgi:hypothetical protein